VLDVFETEEAYVVRMEIAGMRTEDFDILFQEGVLLIRGARPEPPSPPRTYHQSQILLLSAFRTMCAWMTSKPFTRMGFCM